MPERQVEVKTFNVHMDCGETISGNICAGEMLPTGDDVATNPTKYKHICNLCSRQEIYIKVYPHSWIKA